MHYVITSHDNIYFETENELSFGELETYLVDNFDDDPSTALEVLVGDEDKALYKIVRYPVTSTNHGNYAKIGA